ncbi:PREDICTED: rapamycin-insensitive companion of mTOR isoform X1 [Nicrophorus vespilloides]|uniref:Rapamycin-insensitive companion of mTOR isoform X1 n=2 Tax=Nicrophorus vespilloides TaxID=110193 RepID=A0ABM1MB81_NICVS|nr:PREDICTED: rapamycin-insensitive companion of mTOR isoform X1 [Nicrophorus vespilloides]
MAVSSWMLRNRNIRSSKFGKSKQKEEDVIKLNLKLDPHLNAVEILSMLSKTKDVTDAKRLNYLNNFVKLSMHLERNLEPLGFSIEEILYCLRFSLVSNLTQVRSGAFRAIRYVLSNESDVHCFNKLLIPLMVVRSLDLAIKYDIERIEAIKLIRRVLLIAPNLFDKVLARCLVSLANGGVEEKDRLLRVCLAALSELGILNPGLFIECGGVSAITRNLLECQTPRIAESLCGVLLLLLDRPITRDKAVVDLHCVAAPYCDFHYRHGWMDKNRDERELRFNCSRLALLSILRSWPGILHFCSPSDSSGLKAIVAILYLNQLEVRKAVLDLLYELLNLPQPEWTDELSVALSAIDPAEPQASWRLAEGFVVAEGRSVLPHLARTTPSISDMHLSLLLYCFLETGLLEALAEVIATSDTFICVRATVLLGELLRLIQLFLPPECCNITPALPNLLGYATKDKPQALAAVTGLQQLHKLLKRRPASYSLYMDYILRSGNFIKSSNRTEQIRKSKMRHVRSKITQLVMKDGDDVIKETGVLNNKDAYTWNWNVIKMILKGETEHEISASDANDRSFLKRLVDYYTPSSYRYSHMDLTSPKNSQGYTMVGLELIDCLLALNETFFNKLLLEWFENILSNIKSITTSKSAHDCLFSPQHMSNTQCQSYFLFIGRLGSKPAGEQLLLNLSFFQVLQDLATSTNHDCYAKLIVSSLDYQNNKRSIDLLTKVLTCSIESSRLYSTQFLLILLRAGIENFSSWGIKLLAGQLNDQSRSVYLSALASLHEACEVPVYLEELVKVNPDLLHLGEKGMLLLIRFLSVPNGFAALKKKNNNFAIHELQRWDEYFNFRYVFLIEGEIADALTLHQRGEDGRYDKRSSLLRSISKKDLFLPPHIYGQLAKHSEGFQVLCDHGSLMTMVPCVNNGLCESEEDILKLKAALWVLGHLGSSVRGVEFLNSKNSLAGIVNLAKNCQVYSIRATALYALGLIATTKLGADSLFKLGWVCTRHDRHDRWPIIEEENWGEDVPDCSATNRPTSESDRSDLAFSSEMFIADMDSSDTDLDMFLMDTSFQGKSQTLPNQNVSASYHKRSLSESKTFEMWRGYLDKKSDTHLSTDLPQRYRDNSVTESTTSGVSSCESVLGKGILNETRLQTLSPIPSSSSLITIKTPVIKIRRHSESSRRVSMNSITPSDKSTISPCSSSIGKLSHQDLIGYATVRSIRRNQQQNVEDNSDANFQNSNFLRVHSLDRQRKHHTSYTDCETGVFGNYLLGGLSLTSLSSVKKYSVKDSSKKQGCCYMGISLPISLSSLFPENDDYSLMFSRYATTENLEKESEVDSDDSEENCRISKNTKHNLKFCLRCSYDTLTTKKKKCKKGILQEFKECDDNTLNLRENVLENIEMLANPVAYKQSRQVLLNMKQKNPTIFHDICLYSEVCKMVSETSYRLLSRRFVQDIFYDVNFEVFTRDLDLIFTTTRTTAVPKVRNTVNTNEKKLRYTEIAKEKRKIELSGVTPKHVVIGFNVEESPEMASSYVKYEPRSPPLSSVKEENVVSSTENLPNKNSSVHKQNSITDKTESKSLPSAIKTLDQLKLTYNENKFPIKTRDDKTVIK